MKKLEQFTPNRADNEMLVVLKQLDSNCQAVYARSRANDKVRDLCSSLHELSQTCQGWLSVPGTIRVTVMLQPSLPGFDENDDLYSELD
jgi:hypothetical protein